MRDRKRYFRADQRAEAFVEAECIAKLRGDTRSIPMYSPGTIEVLLPVAVRLDPAKEHGNGDSFINQIETMIEKSHSAAEAGIGTLGLLARSFCR